MAHHKKPLYPEVDTSNPHTPTSSSSSSSNLYPHVDRKDLNNLVPDHKANSPKYSPSAPPECTEELLIRIPGAILHLIDKDYSVELACGDLTIVRLLQGSSIVAVLACVNEIQWPLASDEAVVKVDDSHYFFAIRVPTKEHDSSSSDDEDDKTGKKGKRKDSEILLNYGLSIASKGQEGLLKDLDVILHSYSSFSLQRVSQRGIRGDVLDGSVAKEMSPEDLKSEEKKEAMEERCAAYWTTLAPNVEEYSGTAARMIASGSAQLIKGILWCGDVTVDRLKWGNDELKKRLAPGPNAEVSPEMLKRIERVKTVSKMTEKVANGILSGVVTVSGFFTSSVANSSMGKKFFSLIPGEIVLASMDGISRVCDACEVAGRNVMSTSSTVTTGLVSHRYGEEAARATSEGMDAAGHAIGTAWAVFKMRKALNPKSVLKSSSFGKAAAKAAVEDMKAKAKMTK